MGRPDRDRPATPQRARAALAGARVFFALWPDAIARGELGRWSAELHRICGGRRVRDEQLHVTLAFLGRVLLERLPELRALADSLSGPGFTLRFDAPGCWPRKRLVWAAPAKLPDGLNRLAGGLASVLRAAGLEVDDRPYFPHVTLLRDAERHVLPELGGFEWRVRDFVLVESRLQSTGSTYQVIGRWPLVPCADVPYAETASH
jgi:2'-5' RNA ligase